MKVIKIGAVWCSGCLVMKPRWQKIEKKYPWLETEYFEYDESPEIINKYKVGQDIPVFIFLDKNNQEFNRLKGEIGQNQLEDFILENKDK